MQRMAKFVEYSYIVCVPFALVHENPYIIGALNGKT
jgi:hypothetical protein